MLIPRNTRLPALLILAFVTTLVMSGCSDDVDTNGDAPSARLVEVIGHYNIVKFDGMVYGVPQGISINWQKDDLKKVPGMIIDPSFDKVEKTIKSMPGQQEEQGNAVPITGGQSEPILVTSIGHYNIVKFDGKIYGAPQGVVINWHKGDLTKINGMIVGSSVTGVEISAIGHQIGDKFFKLTGTKKT